MSRNAKFWISCLAGIFLLSSIMHLFMPDEGPRPKAVATDDSPIRDPVVSEILKGAAYALIVDPRMPVAEYLGVSRGACKGKRLCHAYVWKNAGDAATAFPVLPREYSAVEFAYIVDRRSGVEGGLWNCTKYKRSNPEECLPKMQ